MTYFKKSQSIVRCGRELRHLSFAILVSMLLAGCGSEGDDNKNSSQTEAESAVWDESNWGETRWQ